MDKTKIPTFMEFLLYWEEMKSSIITKLCNIKKVISSMEEIEIKYEKEDNECNYRGGIREASLSQ